MDTTPLPRFSVWSSHKQAETNALPCDYIFSFESIATGTSLFGTCSDPNVIAEKKGVIILRRPLEFTAGPDTPPEVEPQRYLTKRQFSELIEELNTVVRGASGPGQSALAGLTNVAHAFAALLDIYAMPNPENPDGMADDKDKFRKHFALIIEQGAQ